MNPKKITGRTPEELIQIYNPLAKEDAPERATDRKARRDMREKITAEKTAEKVVRDLFEAEKDGFEYPSKQLEEAVMEGALVSINIAKRAIRNLTDTKRKGKNSYFRTLKSQENAEKGEIGEI